MCARQAHAENATAKGNSLSQLRLYSDLPIKFYRQVLLGLVDCY